MPHRNGALSVRSSVRTSRLPPSHRLAWLCMGRPLVRFCGSAQSTFGSDCWSWGPAQGLRNLWGWYSALPSGASSFCAQARGLGSEVGHWDSNPYVTSRIAARLPQQFGSGASSVHVAELVSLLVGLRWCHPDSWNLLVYDRSSLFNVLSACVTRPLRGLLLLACSPIVVRLKRVLRRLERSWTGSATVPSWRLHQARHPSHWNRSLPVDGKMRRMSSISFNTFGLVGVDIKSHQVNSEIPFASLVAGNEAQDSGCADVIHQPAPVNLCFPTGGMFCFLSYKGSMVVDPRRVVIRNARRAQAQAQWSQRQVQGKVASFPQQVFGACLNAAWYTACVPLPTWRCWCLPTGAAAVDLSRVLYRSVRAIGGGWTEQLHVDPALASLAEQWRVQCGLSSIRSCPLCQTGPGTPRHVVMVYPSMRPLVDMLRDCLEQEFARLVPASVLLERAGTWRTTLESQGRPLGRSDPVDARRWPILTAWRFLVPMPDREPVLSADVNGSSKAAVAAETASDLGYRAILPFALGQAVCRLAASTTTNSFEGERFAVVHNPGDVQQEAVQETARKNQMAPAITVTTLLLLGLLRVRIEYAKRTSFWRACASLFFEETPVDVGPSRGLPAPSTLQGRLVSAAGQSCVKESLPRLFLNLVCAVNPPGCAHWHANIWLRFRHAVCLWWLMGPRPGGQPSYFGRMRGWCSILGVLVLLPPRFLRSWFVTGVAVRVFPPLARLRMR